MSPTRATLAYATSLATIVAAALLILALGLSLVWPVRTLEYQDARLAVPQTVVRAGGVLPLVIRYCKDTTLPERVVGQIVSTDADRLTFVLGALDRNLEPGCHTITSNAWRVPEATQPGRTYTAQFTVTYTLSAWRIETRHSESAPFTVIAPTPVL